MRRALLELKIDDRQAKKLGIKLYKVGMPWPLEPHALRDFASGARELIVVEEKRGLIEDQVRQILYGSVDAPRIIGKLDENGSVLFPVEGRLDASQIATRIGERLAMVSDNETLREALASIRMRSEKLNLEKSPMRRIPYFCAGCPPVHQPLCPRVRGRSRVLAAITWRNGWTGKPLPLRRWGERSELD